MGRYSGSDPYLDPATGVLKNRLGISDEATLQQAEADIVAARFFELSRKPLNGHFDLTHLRAIHKYLLGDLYDWNCGRTAAKARSVSRAVAGIDGMLTSGIAYGGSRFRSSR